MHLLSTPRLAPIPIPNGNGNGNHHLRALLPLLPAAATPVPSPLLRLRARNAESSPPRAVSPATPSTLATDGSTGAQSGNWAEFAALVSGEWDGFGADFTITGDPVELPANVVPDAFREWEIQVFDWQTQCPTLADPATPHALHYRLVRLLPTVGCEADAATVHTSHQRHVSSASAFAYDGADGSYVAAWPKGPATVLEVEHCLVRPDDEKVRVRVVQTVALGKDDAQLRGLKVFAERRYGPYRNGEQLGGCGLEDAAFAAGHRLDASEMVGPWNSTGASAVLSSETGKFVELKPDDEPRRIERDATGIVTLLPKLLWSKFKVNDDDGEVVCEVGMLLDYGSGSAVTSTCVLSKDGDVKEIATAYESRVTESGELLT